MQPEAVSRLVILTASQAEAQTHRQDPVLGSFLMAESRLSRSRVG